MVVMADVDGMSEQCGVKSQHCYKHCASHWLTSAQISTTRGNVKITHPQVTQGHSVIWMYVFVAGVSHEVPSSSSFRGVPLSQVLFRSTQSLLGKVMGSVSSF